MEDEINADCDVTIQTSIGVERGEENQRNATDEKQKRPKTETKEDDEESVRPRIRRRLVIVSIFFVIRQLETDQEVYDAVKNVNSFDKERAEKSDVVLAKLSQDVELECKLRQSSEKDIEHLQEDGATSFYGGVDIVAVVFVKDGMDESDLRDDAQPTDDQSEIGQLVMRRSVFARVVDRCVVQCGEK